jgi:hypothetical protein
VLLAACAASWLALQPTAALAESKPVHLDWDRPIGSTCPPASVLELDVEQTLDRPVFTPEKDAELQIQGYIEELSSGRTSVRLTARDRAGNVLGTRELHAVGGGCAALRSDIVLVLTLLVEREEILAAADDTSLSTALGLSASMLLHVLPRWSVGLGPTVVIQVADILQLRADISYFLPVAVRTASNIEAQLHAVGLALRLCPRLFGQDSTRFSLHACAGAQGGVFITSQTAPAQRALQLRLLAQGQFDMRAGLRVGETTRIELAIGPVLSISRASVYAVYGGGERLFLYQVPLVGAHMQLSLLF